MRMFNYKLDTSNSEENEQSYFERKLYIQNSWNILMAYFINKGHSISFIYWAEDIAQEEMGYPSSGFGIKKIISHGKNSIEEEKELDMELLSTVLDDEVRNFVLQSMNEEVFTYTPFFHFNIQSIEGHTIFTSQDFGDNVLMVCDDNDLEFLLQTNFDTSLLISLPVWQ